MNEKFEQITAGEKEALERAAFERGKAEGLAAGKAEGVTIGATNERERIQSVLSLPHAGHEKLITGLAFDGKTTKPEAAVAILEAERVTREKARTDLATDAPKPLDAGGDPAAESQGGTVEERCKKNWAANKDNVRSNYLSVEGYIAFEKQMAGGNVRILEKK